MLLLLLKVWQYESYGSCVGVQQPPNILLLYNAYDSLKVAIEAATYELRVYKISLIRSVKTNDRKIEAAKDEKVA